METVTNVLLIRKASKQIPIYQMNPGISFKSKMVDINLSKASSSVLSKGRCLEFGQVPSLVLKRQYRALIVHYSCILHSIQNGDADVVKSKLLPNHASIAYVALRRKYWVMERAKVVNRIQNLVKIKSNVFQ